MHKPFDNEIENKKYESLYNTISSKINKIILSTDSEIMRYMEIVCSTLLLEINKKFPELFNLSNIQSKIIKKQYCKIRRLHKKIKRN